MVARRHRRATHRRAEPQPALPAGLAQLYIAVVHVAHLTYGGHTFLAHQPHLAAGEPQRRIVPFLGQHLRRRTGRAHHLAPSSRGQLDIMHQRAERNTCQWKRVPHANLRPLTTHHRITHLQPQRRDDVPFLAVVIDQQRDAGRAVGIILNTAHPRRNVHLVALEINQPVSSLVSTTSMAHRDTSLHVTASPLAQWAQQAALRLRARDLLESRTGHSPPAG